MDDVRSVLKKADAHLLAVGTLFEVDLELQRVSPTLRAKVRSFLETERAALDQLAPPRLTSREEEVAHLAVVGLNNSDIAERLFLSVRTVETHLAHVYTKLGIRSRAQLVDTMAPVNSMLFPGR